MSFIFHIYYHVQTLQVFIGVYYTFINSYFDFNWKNNKILSKGRVYSGFIICKVDLKVDPILENDATIIKTHDSIMKPKKKG